MKTISQWASTFDVNEKPWLLLGKGPSFDKFERLMGPRFYTMALNHVVCKTPVTVAHFIDIDAFVDCIPSVSNNAKWVCMPWHPHERFLPSKKTLAQYASELPQLNLLHEEGRLLCYNLSTGEKFERFPGAPLIEAEFFSAEAGLNILAECGVKVVCSLGIDGGASYARQFDDMASKTRLANRHSTFDLQFSGIARTIRRTGIQYAPLYVESPARVFVGGDDAQELPYRVLEFSTKKYASLSVEFHRIDDRGLKVPDSPKNRSRTGFSFSRFRIPSLCGYRGRAIYFDADMQVFSDIIDLWTLPFNGASVLYADHDSADSRVPQFSVLLLNCSELDWEPNRIIDGLDEGTWTYESLMYNFGMMPDEKKRPSLPSEWNSLERYVPGKTKLLHYTDMPTQPWVTRKNRSSKLWLADLKLALQEGFITEEFLFDQIQRGRVSPELPGWLGIRDRGQLQPKDKASWTPPYRRLHKCSRKHPFPRDARTAWLAATLHLRSMAFRAGNLWARVRNEWRVRSND